MLRRLAASVLLFACIALAQTQPASSGDVEKRVNDILSKMTLEEKIDYIGGYDSFYVRAVPRLGLPAFKMSDGPIGVRNYGPSTTYAAGIGLAASFDTKLANEIGTMIGKDARARGVHFMLGPGVNIYRAPMNGRNFEYFGEDPFLAQRVTVEYVKGMQAQGVSATVKHYMGNNSEYLRHDSDSVIDERTMREIYFPAFEGAVREAHVGAIMDSYNFINGTHATQNKFTNIEVAKKEWGFDGVMMSDWDATYDGVAAANGGLDLEMPDAKFMNAKTLLPAIKSGAVTEATIDDKVRRILRLAARMGWLDREQQDNSISLYNQQGREVALQSARESIVLLKNENNLLPLDKTKTRTVLVVGPDAYPFVADGGGSAHVRPFAGVSVMEGISNLLGTAGTVQYRRGLPSLNDIVRETKYQTAEQGGQPGVTLETFDNGDLSGTPVKTGTVRSIQTSTRDLSFDTASDEDMAAFHRGQISLRWTGYYTPEHPGVQQIFLQGPGEGGSYRVSIDGKTVLDNWKLHTMFVGQADIDLTRGPHKVVVECAIRGTFPRPMVRFGIADPTTVVDPEVKSLAAKTDAVIVVSGFNEQNESEGADRTFTLPVGQAELIRQVEEANKNTIVVNISGGSVETSPWLANTPAFVQAWYPGQEGGTAVAEMLFGEANPSGRLPISWERELKDDPDFAHYYPEPGTNKVNYAEGIFTGYRGYEHNGTQPLFPFGYGLSYTTFRYANLTLYKSGMDDLAVSFDVTNAGKREGAEVAELYVGEAHPSVPRPKKELKGFSRVSLQPGETQHVTIELGFRSFAYFNDRTKTWDADADDYRISIGPSSQQIELTTMVKMPGGRASTPGGPQ